MKKLATLLFIGILLVFPTVFAQQAQLLEVSLLNYNPDPVQPGQVMDLQLQVIRKGITAVSEGERQPYAVDENAWIEIVGDAPFTLLETEDLLRSDNLGTVAFTETLFFRIKVSETARDGVYPLTVRYGVGDRSTYNEERFDINVETFDARLNIVNVEQTPAEVEPGEEVTLSFTILNNDDKPLSNVDLTLDLTDSYDINANMNNMVAIQAMINARLEEVNRRVASGLSPLVGATPMVRADEMGQKVTTGFSAFAPVGSSNQKRYGTIGAGESIAVDFKLMALPDTIPYIYAIPLYLSYNDENNVPFHLRVDVPLTVNMGPEPHAELKSSNLRTTDFAGEVVVTVANRGLGDMRYATIILEDDKSYQLLTAPRTSYLGDLSAGESTNTTFRIIAEEKILALPVTIEYRDAFNQKQTHKTTLALEIINKNYYRDLPFEMWLAWIILGIVILGLTLYYVRNMTKKND